MKYQLFFITFLLLGSLTVHCQILNYGDPSVKGNIESLVERTNKHKNDWREYSFDSLSRITEIKYIRDKNLIETELLRYNSNSEALTEINEIYLNERGSHYLNSKYYYDSNKRIIKYERFKEGSDIPMIVELNAKYDGDKIKELDRILIPKDTSVIEHYSFTNLKNKTIIKKSDNKGISSETITIILDKKGNCIKKDIDYNDPKAVLGGVRTYSPFRKDKYVKIYKYDKNGNWIQSYSKTLLRKIKLDHRDIKYK
jgi:hypothetical protein